MTTNRKSNTAFLVANASKNIVDRFLNKNLAVGIPRWFVSPNFAKAFDRAHWPALSKSLFEQGMISKLYEGWFGTIWTGHQTDSDCRFEAKKKHIYINSAVRQRCVLSPRFFCAVLQFAMRKWALKVLICRMGCRIPLTHTWPLERGNCRIPRWPSTITESGITSKHRNDWVVCSLCTHRNNPVSDWQYHLQPVAKAYHAN